MSDGSVGTISLANSVYVNGKRLMVIGSKTSSEGIMITGSAKVFAEGLPVCRLTDRSTSLLFGQAEVVVGSLNTHSG